MKKKLLILLLAGTLVLATACGNAGSTSSDQANSTANEIGLEYVTPADLAADGALTTENGGGGAPQGQPPGNSNGDSQNDQAAGNSNSDSDSNSQNGQPPTPPSGDSNSSQSGQPPEKPEGAPDGAPPDLPDGAEKPEGAPDGAPPSKPGSDSDSSKSSDSDSSKSNGSDSDSNKSKSSDSSKSGGADTKNFDYSGSYTGAVTADGSSDKDEEKEVTSEGETVKASDSDQNALLAQNGGTLTVSGATIEKSGDDNDGDRCNFYGLNSSVLATGESSKIYLDSTKIESDSAGSNALFATDSGTIYANSTSITTTKGDNSRGLDATYGGVIYGNDLDISTEKDHCAALATDRGGGYISVTGSKLATAGSGSPLLYSTGDIEVDNVTGTASGSQIAGMEGYNRIIVYNSELESTNDAISGSDPVKNGVILYQSMSGDADTSSSAVADFEAVNSKLTTAITDGAMFYVTNTKAKVVLKNTEIQTGSDKVALIQATGNSSNNWGTEGKNGGNLTFTGYGETLSGDIITDTISSADVYLLEGTTWTGATEIQENSGSSSDKQDNGNDANAETVAAGNEEASGGSAADDTLKVSVDGTSTWVVTGDCTVSSLAVADGGKVVDKDGKTVTIKSSDKTYVEGDSTITVTVTGTYSDSVDAGELTQPATKVLDRSEFDSHFGTTTKFGYAGKE